MRLKIQAAGDGEAVEGKIDDGSGTAGSSGARVHEEGDPHP